MIKREYEIEKKKKKKKQQIKEREWEWLESGWELLSLQIIFFFFKSPKIVKVASCDWGNIASNFFHEMLRWFVLPYSKLGNDYLHLKWIYFLIRNTQLLLYTNFKCIFLVK